MTVATSPARRPCFSSSPGRSFTSAPLLGSQPAGAATGAAKAPGMAGMLTALGLPLLGHHHLGIDRAGLVAAKTTAGIGFQGAMQGGALHPSWKWAEGFSQPCCRFASGRQQQCLALCCIGEKLPHAGGFAGASSANKKKTLVLVKPLLQLLEQALLLQVLPPAPEFSALVFPLDQHQGQLVQSFFGCRSQLRKLR